MYNKQIVFLRENRFCEQLNTYTHVCADEIEIAVDIRRAIIYTSTDD